MPAHGREHVVLEDLQVRLVAVAPARLPPPWLAWRLAAARSGRRSRGRGRGHDVDGCGGCRPPRRPGPGGLLLVRCWFRVLVPVLVAVWLSGLASGPGCRSAGRSGRVAACGCGRRSVVGLRLVGARASPGLRLGRRRWARLGRGGLGLGSALLAPWSAVPWPRPGRRPATALGSLDRGDELGLLHPGRLDPQAAGHLLQLGQQHAAEPAPRLVGVGRWLRSGVLPSGAAATPS